MDKHKRNRRIEEPGSQAATANAVIPSPAPVAGGLRRRQTIFVIVIDVDYVRLDGRVGDCRNGKAVLSVGWASWLGSVTPKSWFIGLTGGEGDLAQNIRDHMCNNIANRRHADDGEWGWSALGERRWNRDDNYAATNVYLKERPHHHQQQ